MIDSSGKQLGKFLKDFNKNPDFVFVQKLLKKFEGAEVFIVGGIVRDLLLERESKDVDLVVRGVQGEELEKFLSKEGEVNLVGKSFGVFKFKNRKGDEEIDIALPRTDHSFNTGGYHDFEIQSDPKLPIEKDLERRDFTINAMALNVATGELVDPFDGLKDLESKTIRTVGKPELRFQEDYTRMLRAVRFATQLEFEIEPKTYKVIQKLAQEIATIPAERIRYEFDKIIMCPNAEDGLILLQKSGLLKQFIPELEEGIGVGQNKNHIYTVFEHNIKSLGAAAQRGYTHEVRLAALFHDIAKPETKEGEGKDCTFYNHEVVGKPKTYRILKRLKYPKEILRIVPHLVRHHMFYYSLDEVTDAAVRRLISRVGAENINQLIQLRMCDRLGMGRPKAKPYKLKKLEERIQVVQVDPVSVKMLAIDGNDIMQTLGIEPSIRIKYLQEALMSEILDDPASNTKTHLLQRLKELHTLTDGELKEKAPDFQALRKEQEMQVIKEHEFVD